MSDERHIRDRSLWLDTFPGPIRPRAALQGELRRIHHELALTSILVTHDLVEALALADRIAVMVRGELVQIGTPAELMTTPAHPYVASLVAMAHTQGELLLRARTPS